MGGCCSSKAQELADKLAKEEEERKAKEADKLAKEEEERKAKELENQLAKEEEERKAKEAKQAAEAEAAEDPFLQELKLKQKQRVDQPPANKTKRACAVTVHSDILQ